MNIQWIDEYTNNAVGPIQRDEAMFLSSLIKVINPKHIIELGTEFGFSTNAMLQGMDIDATLITYDTREPDQRVMNRIGNDKRVKLVHKGQELFDEECEEGIDFLFIDASHDLEINQISFKRIYNLLNPTAIIAIHDTGLTKEKVGDRGHMTDEGYAHQPDERVFVNWLVKEYKFGAIHFHTMRTKRYGLTLLQKQITLKI